MGCEDYRLPEESWSIVTFKPRWRVCKRDGVWRIYNRRGVWHDSDDTLVGAHTYATQLAVADELFADGGLTRLRTLQSLARRTALRACPGMTRLATDAGLHVESFWA